MSSGKNHKRYLALGCAVAFIIAFAMMIVILKVYHYAPFGTNSMAFADINNTQLDLYGYLKDILSGKNALGYSFSMYLGGDTMNVFSYSMASPLNLLVIFFDKSQFHTFFNILMALKIGFIASSMFFFLTKRFDERINKVFVYSLSFAYAYSQYVIAQTCNIFWLDGIFFLPLFLWGLYKVIRDKKPSFFTVTIAFSIIFNWYTGIINCIFCVFWFFLEVFWYRCEEGRIGVRKGIVIFFRTLMSGLSGVLISAVLFLPTMMAVRQGNRGTILWKYLSNTFNGNILTAFTNYTIGSVSTQSAISLYCGSIVIVGCFCFFVNKKIEKWKKRILGLFLGTVVLSFYWQPLTFLFSMLKYATSFWFRYGYIGIFTVIFIAANYYMYFCLDSLFETSSAVFVIIYSVSIFFFNKDASGYPLKLLYASVFFCLLFIMTVLLWRYAGKKQQKRCLSVMLVTVVCAELGYNAKILMPQYTIDDVEAYSAYTRDEETLIDNIKADDPGAYRITQTLTRNMAPGELTANYNESFGYGYWSISGYTNSPDDMQRNFFDKIGYRMNGENMYIVNTSILPVDSLLGIRYVLSNYSIMGLDKEDRYGVTNQKSVYRNPYAFPMAFLHYRSQDNYVLKKNISNPFEYQNMLYSELLGEKTDIFRGIDYSESIQKNGKSVSYKLSIPEGSYALYGNLPWENESNEEIIVEGKKLTPYAVWGSPSVFYIPNTSNKNTVSVEVTSETGVSIKEAQFYMLDLDALNKAREEIVADNIEDANIQNGHVRMEFDSKEGQEVFTSIPYNSAWTVTDNGKIIEPKKFADCLMVLPLSAGHHVIEMHYHVPGVKAGVVCMILGLILLIFMYIMERKRDSRRAKNNGK